MLVVVVAVGIENIRCRADSGNYAQSRETALPTGKIERETTQGRADVGDVPTARTLGALAREVLSSSRHVQSRELARAVLRLLARSKKQS